MEFGREGMDTMEFLDFTDAGAVAEYERFIQDSKGSFMQSVLWCAVKPDWLHEAVISRDSAGKIAGSMLVLIKRFPPPMKSFLYSPRGPVWDYRNMDVLWDLLRGVWQLSRNYHAYALKADPLIEETDSDRIFALRSAGFTYRPFQEDAQVIQSRNNYLLELRGRNEEELMASFKSKCRYNIKLAQRKGVTCGSYGKERLPEFERLMLEIAAQPIRFFLNFNAVIVNLAGLSPENRELCLTSIENGVKTLKAYLADNIGAKEHVPEIPETGMAVLRQQLLLAQAVEAWMASLREGLGE